MPPAESTVGGEIRVRGAARSENDGTGWIAAGPWELRLPLLDQLSGLRGSLRLRLPASRASQVGEP
jgi:hypothetical protein